MVPPRAQTPDAAPCPRKMPTGSAFRESRRASHDCTYEALKENNKD